MLIVPVLLFCSQAQHKSYNEYLNSLVVETDPRNPANAEQPRVPIHYKHRREIDKFFEIPPAMREQLPSCIQNLIPPKHTVKVRVTHDQKTKEILAKIIKARIADINLYFPMCPLDCRLSINLEMTWDGSVEELERLSAGREGLPDRNKDRLSYSQSHYQMDLTQVTQMVPGLSVSLTPPPPLPLPLSRAPLLTSHRALGWRRNTS